MLIAFNKEFAGRKVGRVENLPDRIASVLVRKGYASVTGEQPSKKLAKSTVKPQVKHRVKK